MKFFQNINWVWVKTYVPFVFLGAAILLEIIVATVFIPKKVFSLLELSGKIGQLTADVKQLTDAEKSLSAVDNDQLVALFQKADFALPDEKRVAGVISGLSSLASSSAVVVKNIEFSPGRISTGSGVASEKLSNDLVGDKVRAVKASLSVTASLGNFLSFLTKIQSSVQLLGVTGISYKISGTSPGGEMNLLVYYLPTRLSEPSLSFVPAISPDDVKVIQELSGPNVFNLLTK